MKNIKIGIVREGKTPMDHRVPLLPFQAKEVKEKYPEIEIFCQASTIRCVKDEEYLDAGIPVVENIDHCDILFGVKEVPLNQLIPDKTYFFFSHTIKKQAYNRELLKEIVKKNIRLIDYETLKDEDNNRIIAFGRFAGIVGAYNGILTYGKKFNLFHLKRAKDCYDLNSLKNEYKKVKLPPVKIIITGGGRVGNGAKEVMEDMGIKQVSPEDFLNKEYPFPVYCQLRSTDYHYHRTGKPFDPSDFYKDPSQYESDFSKYLKVTDIFIAGAYWDIKAPALFTREDLLSNSQKLKVVADITCDIQGSIPTTKQASTIDDPFYDYNPVDDQVKPAFSNPEFITVMAIDNLPGELARDASESFGHQLINSIIPALIDENGKKELIKRATITENGKLTERFNYLQDFLNGK